MKFSFKPSKYNLVDLWFCFFFIITYLIQKKFYSSFTNCSHNRKIDFKNKAMITKKGDLFDFLVLVLAGMSPLRKLFNKIYIACSFGI